MSDADGMLDDIVPEIIAWAKAYARVEQARKLDLHHLLLAALKTDTGRQVLAEILNSTLPEQPEQFEPALKSYQEKATAPVTDERLPLSPRLKEITREVWGRNGGLLAEPLLRKIVASLRNDRKWKSMLWDPAADEQQIRLDEPAPWDELNKKILKLRRHLAGRIRGQEQAIEAVCQAYYRAELCRRRWDDDSETGPRIIMTFVGPPGVGKTYLAREFANYHRNGTKGAALLRLDMSAYSGHQAHEQLTGSNPAYKGANVGILTGFVEANPEAVILVDEIEKAHVNTQNLFLQILDAGVLFDSHTKKNVIFSAVTVIFTTNLGSEIYDAPNRSGVLSDSSLLSETVLEALGSASGHNNGGCFLSPELLSRLSKGNIVLFRRLEALAMERMVESAVRNCSARLSSSIKLRLEVEEDVILSLFVLRFGLNGDGRRLVTGVQNFLYATVHKILRDDLAMKALVQSGSNTLHFKLPDMDEIPDHAYQCLTRRLVLLVIDDDTWDQDVGEGVELKHVRNLTDADESIRHQQPDMVLLDLHIGTCYDSRDLNQGLGILRWLRTSFPELPVYLFSELPRHRGLSEETLEQVVREGGARGLLHKEFGNDLPHLDSEAGEAFLGQINECVAELRRHILVRSYQRRLQTIHFEIFPRVIKAGEPPVLEIQRLREVTVISAADRKQSALVDIPNVRFSDLAGIRQAKTRLEEIVRWLQDDRSLKQFGIEVPKGILLTGPPGTGKTTLARAVAGEAQVPFLALSGSSIFSKWLGESEERIREIFACARRYAPSVIFIDEIDSVGRRRSDGEDFSIRASTSVLNELLSQMDGFSRSERPVFVLAATNRPDILDPALCRPGRFDLQIEVPRPDAEARKELFQLYLKQMPCAEGLDLEVLVSRTGGVSGAEIQQICKEAAMLALRRRGKAIQPSDIQEAVTNICMGLASERPLLDQELRWSIAVHEAGHALAQHLLMPNQPLVQLTILPRGKALGFSEHASRAEYETLTAKKVEYRVRVLLAGRAAEEQLLGPGSVTAGCESDLRRATALASSFMMRWAMASQNSMVNLRGMQDVFGTDQALAGSELINHWVAKVKQWLQEQMEATRALLQEKEQILKSLASYLNEKETLYDEDLKKFFASHTL